MAAPKRNYSSLFQEKDESQNLQDKKKIEALKKRLNDKLLKDTNFQKKAALILESWINKKTKR